MEEKTKGKSKGQPVEIDMSAFGEVPYSEVPKTAADDVQKKVQPSSGVKPSVTGGLVNCLRNVHVKVQYVPKEFGNIEDRNHPFWGGLAQTATITLCTPMIKGSSTLVDPLTREEREFLEEYMGLEPNALSVHRKVNNFWDTRAVTIGKDGLVLDLTDPMQYIDYKILLANKEIVAPNVEALRDNPKETYRFVLVSEDEMYNETAERVSIKSKCWKEYNKYENDRDALRAIIEIIDHSSVSGSVRLESLQDKVMRMIERDARLFHSIVTDSLFPMKVLVVTGAGCDIIAKRGDNYYYRGEPLCGRGENPTLNAAAAWLSTMAAQDVKFAIEALVRKAKEK